MVLNLLNLLIDEAIGYNTFIVINITIGFI